MVLHSHSGNWRWGLTLACLAALLWGSLPLALAIALQALDVYTITWFRFTLSGLILGLYLLLQHQLPPLSKITPPTWQLLGAATVFLAVNYVLFLQGLALTSPATAEVLIQFAPAFFGLGAIAIFKEKYTGRQWLGLSILVLGLILFFQEKINSLLHSPANYFWGAVLVIIGAAAWAIYALAQKQLLLQLSSVQIMFLLYAGCALLFSPFARPQTLLDQNPLQWGMLVFCGLNTVIGYGSFAESLAHWDASRVSAIIALAPLITVAVVEGAAYFFPTLIEPENLTLVGLLGAVLVVVGSIAIALNRRYLRENSSQQ